MKSWGAFDIVSAAIIGAWYALLTIILAPISYGVYQIRLAEALAVLPFIFPLAPIGLFVGCLVANIFGGNGIQDIVFGSFFTLIAGYLTYFASKIKSRELALAIAPLPPVLINAFGVALYLSSITGLPYLFVTQMVGVGEIVACYALGLPLLIFLTSKRSPLSRLRGRI